MTSTFTVKKGPTQWGARVYSEDGTEVAVIRKGEGPEFRLSSKKENREWVLTNKIDGEHRPFSFTVKDAERKEQGEGTSLLTIRDNIFMHNGKFYMLANNPQGKSWQHHVKSLVRYISRLDNFPHSDSEENKHHQHLKQKVKRFRGVPVGEASGLGATPDGHRVMVNDELEDIGLFLAVTSYLMYASA